jgi:hypothetical protein
MLLNMKKFLLIAFIASLFASASAFAGGACCPVTGAKAAKAEAPCAEMAAACTAKCCGTCTAKCDKPCGAKDAKMAEACGAEKCGKADKAEATAVAPACCPVTGKAA